VYWTVTTSPMWDGSGESDVIDVVVSAWLTVCDSVADTLPLKFESPAYVAVNDFAPALVNVMSHWPAATVAVHDKVPSLTVTFPVGVPPNDVTVYCTVTDSPTTEESGESDVIDVVVSHLSTVCGSVADTLPLKSESPAYVAVSDRAPAVVRTMSHWPAATVAVQLSTPSLTVTSPVGVPAPGESATTAYCTVTAAPTTEESGESDVMDVVVSAWLTVWGSAPDALPLKSASPA
jgi:hypothetical protein